jgi:dihydrofolate synthase/folylpolyglutamate synthase
MGTGPSGWAPQLKAFPEAIAPRLEDAIDQAATLAEEGGVFGEAIGSGGVLVTGSVVTVGEARRMLKPRGRQT